MKYATLVLLGGVCAGTMGFPLPSARAQSTRSGLGAWPYADAAGTGVTFRVWAPNASRVTVAGQFNGWNTAQDPLWAESNGLWSADITGAAVGQEFKYVINDSLWRRDPRSRLVVNSDGNAIIYDPAAFDWAGDTPVLPALDDLVIYEMHAGTFYAPAGTPGKFVNDIQKLDHLREMGVNAVELMPVMEFPGDHSWGYNPADLFAVENFAYGGADGLKKFVRACHARNIAVLLDVIHNHYGPSDLSLWQFDGWSVGDRGGIYFYNEDGKCCTPWGSTRPDFGRPEVRAFITDQIRMWLDEYHVDGFRWDTPFYMTHYGDSFDYLPEGASLLQEINSLMATGYPGRIRIAEDDGLGNGHDSEWDVGFRDHLKWQVTQSSDAARDMFALASHIQSGAGLGRVIYTESHDAVGDLNSNERLPYDIDPADPDGIWARKRSILAAGVMLTSPGVPMVFQGQEMLEVWPFSNFTALRWDRTNTQAGIVRAYTDLIRARRNLAEGTQGLKGSGCNVYWTDDANKVIAYVRWDAGGGSDDVVVLANFAATTWEGGSYQLEFPSAGTWYAHFNSDSSTYGDDFGDIGFLSVAASGSPATAAVDMGMYSLQIFSKAPPIPVGLVATDPTTVAGCVDIMISYDPNGGALTSAAPVYLHLGRNDWAETNTPDAAMMPVGDGTWTYAYTVPFDTYELNCTFNDGSGGSDDRYGLGWTIPVAACTNGTPAQVAFTPSQPSNCDDITVTYEPRGGPLQAADPIYIHIGRNGWQDIVTPDSAMTEAAPGMWTYTYGVSSETYRVQCAFHDGAGTWDNNNLLDWSVLVTGCATTRPSDLSMVYGKPQVSSAPVDQADQNNIGDRFDLNREGGRAVTVQQGGFGDFGQIYMNYDETNFYIGATDCQLSGNDSAMLIFLDFNTMSVNVPNLWGLSGQPVGLDFLHNVWFETPMDLAIVLGDEFADDTYWDFQLGNGSEFGQGVFRLVSEAPGFAAVEGARLSQFDGTGTEPTVSADDDLNRTTDRWEACIPWAGLFANGFGSVTSCVIAGVIANDNVSGTDRYLSSNYLGLDASSGGFDSLGNFGATNFVHLYGLPVSLHPRDDDGDGLPNGWELLHFGNPTNADPNVDSDTNGFSNLEEYIADSDPSLPSSKPPELKVERGSTVRVVVSPASANRIYDIFTTTNLAGQAWQPLVVGKPGQGNEVAVGIPPDADSAIFHSAVRHP